MLLDKINSDLKTAMREKNELVLSVLRMLISAIRNKEISERKDGEAKLSENDVMAVLKSEVKKRRDSILAFTDGNREDLANKEKKEIEILSVYLPVAMSETEVEKIVKQVIAEMGKVTMSDFGKIMGMAMGKTKGSADGNVVSAMVKKMLM